mmetsp:Transcript_14822/g.27870  ORF Transcript_14822/g.27870 Transcript_14822/m.27870 type:complete len:88 (-) Transcript_14822:6-269(-)
MMQHSFFVLVLSVLDCTSLDYAANLHPRELMLEYLIIVIITIMMIMILLSRVIVVGYAYSLFVLFERSCDKNHESKSWILLEKESVE